MPTQALRSWTKKYNAAWIWELNMDEQGKVRGGREYFYFIGESMFLWLNFQVKGSLKKFSEDGIFLHDSWSVIFYFFLVKKNKVYSKMKFYPRQLLTKNLTSKTIVKEVMISQNFYDILLIKNPYFHLFCCFSEALLPLALLHWCILMCSSHCTQLQLWIKLFFNFS